MKWISSAPANVMLLGEHSVVAGKPAILAALEPIIEIKWQPIEQHKIQINSDLSNFSTSFNSTDEHPKLRFVLQALRQFRAKLATDLPFGLQLDIRSEFPADWGLGSSAAVLAACLTGFNQISTSQLTNWQLFELGHQVILSIQQRGSGADLAASLTGGLAFFDPTNKILQALPVPDFLRDLSLIYAGYKTPTSDVLALVHDKWQEDQNTLQQIYQQMATATVQAKTAIETQNPADFWQAINQYQNLMRQLGVSDPTLETIIQQAQPTHAKISGSGLGDCVVAFGKIQPANFATLNTKINPQAAFAIQI